ncbi:MAG: cell division protein FtsQ/DivIB [Terriglobia bacterium]
MVSLPEQFRLPDERLAENVLPFRKVPKPVAARRGGSSLWARLLKTVVWSLLLLVAGGGVFRIAQRAAASNRFLLDPERNVTVEGNHYVSREEVFDALGFGDIQARQEVNLFRINLLAEKKRLEAIPWIESAAVTRVFPHHLLVRVAERTPIAFANVGGRLKLVDKYGVLLQMPAKASFDFPVVDGLDPAASPAGRAALLGPYLELMKETRAEAARSGWIVSEVNLSDPNDVRVLMVQGRETVLVHFGNQNFEHRFEVFTTLVPRVLASYSRVNSMDLRYHNEVVVDPFNAIAQVSGNRKKAAAR